MGLAESNGQRDSHLACARCGFGACEWPDEQEPKNCSQHQIDGELRESVNARYASPENHVLMEAAARVSEETVNSSRVEDTLKFAHFIGAKRVGIATCVSLLSETRILAKLLERAGFEVEGVGCKLDGNHRCDLGLSAKEDGTQGGVLCNPIMQAELLNRAGTDLNILMGICVGHDALFCKYSNAPVTTLVAKDFLTGNNPAAALYTSNSVYKNRLEGTIARIS